MAQPSSCTGSGFRFEIGDARPDLAWAGYATSGNSSSALLTLMRNAFTLSLPAAANVLDVSASGTQTPENDDALQGGQIVANPMSLGAAGTSSVQVASRPPSPTPGRSERSSASTR